MIAVALLLASLGGLPSGDALVERVRSAALADCHTNKRPPVEVVDALIQIERDVGIPDEARGLLLAAACNESGFRARVAGDGGRSVGMFQLFPWAKRRAVKLQIETTERDVRLDWRASALIYADHTRRQLPKVRRDCKGRRGFVTRSQMLWASANAQAIRYPLCARRDVKGRCLQRKTRCARKGRGSETLHFKMLRRWRKGR